MKKLLIIGCCLAWCALVVTVAHAESGLQRVSDHVYSYLDVQNASPGSSFGANAGIIVGEKGVAVIDTMVSAKEGERLLADIKAVTDKPIRYVINTHSHLDHTFGNSIFAKLGATIIAQDNCAGSMRRNTAAGIANAGEYGLTPEQMAGTEPAYPEITFTDRLSLDLGDVDVDLLYVGPSHSPGSIMVLVAGESTVFAGDILFSNFYPYMGDGDIPGWLHALDILESLGAERIIPGHGPLSTKNDVEDMRRYLVRFDENARRLVAGSGTAETIAAELKKLLPSRAQGEGLIQASVQAKYLPSRAK